MYASVDINELIDTARVFISDNDRAIYAPYYKFIEEFATANNIMLGGVNGISLMTGKKPLDIIYELYCDNVFNTGKILTEALYNIKNRHIDRKYIALQTNIRHHEVTVLVNTRRVAVIHSMTRFKGQVVNDIIPIPTTAGFYTPAVPVMYANILLADIYRGLYTPRRFSEDLDGLLASESMLYSRVIAISGGHDDERGYSSSGSDGEYTGGRRERGHKRGHKRSHKPAHSGPNALTAAIMDRINSDNKSRIHNKRVIIGDMALSLLNLPCGRRLQFISDDTAEGITAMVESECRTLGISYTLKVNTYNIVVNDFQLTQYTIFNHNDIVCDVFNSIEYELIPYSRIDGTIIGTPWVLLRYKIIDLWTLTLVSSVTSVRSFVSILLANIHTLREYALEHQTYPISDYSGVWTNEAVKRKQLMFSQGAPPPMWIPYAERN